MPPQDVATWNGVWPESFQSLKSSGFRPVVRPNDMFNMFRTVDVPLGEVNFSQLGPRRGLVGIAEETEAAMAIRGKHLTTADGIQL